MAGSSLFAQGGEPHTPHLNLPNRRMRTRTYGGEGGAQPVIAGCPLPNSIGFSWAGGGPLPQPLPQNCLGEGS
jgi:hypothetical protein